MSTELTTVSPYDNLLRVSKILGQKRIRHIPVLEDSKMVGMISNTDLERAKHGKTFFVNHKIEECNDALLETTFVKSIMTKEVKFINSEDTLSKAYSMFKTNSFRSLPVLENGTLVGIITPNDLLDYFFQLKEESWGISG